MRIDAPSLALLLLCSFICGGRAFAVTVDPSDSNIQYTGRWDDSDSSEPWAQAKGTSITVSFEGTSIGVTMTTGGSEYFRVIIDDDASSSSKIQIPSGVPTTLSSGLADDVHKLELVKETDQSRASLLAIELDAGKSLTAPPPRPSRRIVFYGDSNLAGYSLESERNQGSSNLLGSHYTYAGITSRMFDAEHHNVSKSGATIQTLNSSYDRIDWSSNSPSWTFDDFVADVVVVNIGANDEFRPKSTNKTRYHNLLDDLRDHHPTSHIMLYNAYGWDTTEPANYTHEVIAERADPNMSYAVFPWLFEQFHGCETDHAGMAQYLAEHLSSVMGWVPKPGDVVSGYGRGDDVANGGFEGEAPFGGWAWRYLDDPGVSRVYDSSGAFRGDHYLRLSNGATSQQTNPAADAEVRSVVTWLRGASDGDEVDLTMSFRGQQDGAQISSPIQASTQTKVLTTDWQPHTMTVTAPTVGGDPVYSLRVHFEAGSGDTVDIDEVVTIVPEPGPLALLTVGAGLLWMLGDGRRRC